MYKLAGLFRVKMECNCTDCKAHLIFHADPFAQTEMEGLEPLIKMGWRFIGNVHDKSVLCCPLCSKKRGLK